MPLAFGKQVAGGVEWLCKLIIQSVEPCWSSSRNRRFAAAAAHEEDDNTLSGSTGRGVKNDKPPCLVTTVVPRENRGTE